MTSPVHVLINGVLLPSDAAHIPATCEGFLYGHGVFETIKVIGRRVAFLDHHHARLTSSAATLDLLYTVGLADLRQRIRRVIEANSLVDGSVKIVVFNDGDTTGELITSKPDAYPQETYTRGFHLRTAFTGERTGALTGHKNLNYLANIRAKRAALAAGFDEALFLTPAGIVLEGATTNIFVVRDGLVHTPAPGCGPLPGIARARVIALIGAARVRESLLTHAELLRADEVFVTNALLGVMAVSRIDDRLLATGDRTRTLATDYRALEMSSLE